MTWRPLRIADCDGWMLWVVFITCGLSATYSVSSLYDGLLPYFK